MHRRLLFAILVWSVLALGALTQDAPALKLPAILGNNMVLQQGKPVPVWGWATPGEAVIVKIAGQEKATKADANGKWQVKLDPLKAGGGPYELTVAGATTITLKNILVGEVWVCSGQSNMQFGTGGALNAAEEIKQATFPNIRLFVTNYAAPAAPAADCQGAWAECSPQTVGGFSAVGYFFGRKLHQDLGVPVGLIDSAVGGTPVESWTSREGLAAEPEGKLFAERLDQIMAAYPEAVKKYEETLANFEKDKAAADAAKPDDSTWGTADLDDTKWQDMALPTRWEAVGLDIDGVVWFRTSVAVPEAWVGKDLSLKLGPIDDNDITYVNGEKVGETNGWTTPRVYPVPGKLVKAGKLVIAVRVTDTGGAGGIWGKPEDLTLAPAAGEGKDALTLAGKWRYAVAVKLLPRPGPPMGPGNAWLPTSLYNGMIAPLVPFAIQGAIWYQGEANAGRAYQYRALMPAMIRDWRRVWGQGDLAFGMVQLANFTAAVPTPGDSDWAELREAQTLALKTPNTGMAVIIDIGDAADIHPKNKQDVGLRLALWALAQTYGKKLVYSGPLYDSLKIDGDKVRLSFKHLGGGLVAKGGALKTFAIAGEDKKWVWADAVIDGATVVVSSAQVPKPVAVRYAWANNPEGCNLYNQEGLPASPFRSDDWPGITANNK